MSIPSGLSWVKFHFIWSRLDCNHFWADWMFQELWRDNTQLTSASAGLGQTFGVWKSFKNNHGKRKSTMRMKHLYCSLSDRHGWPARGFPHRCGGAEWGLLLTCGCGQRRGASEHHRGDHRVNRAETEEKFSPDWKDQRKEKMIYGFKWNYNKTREKNANIKGSWI